MSNLAQRRVQKEYKDCLDSEEVKNSGIKLELEDDKFTKLNGTIDGPKESPYEGGKFSLKIEIPEKYPHVPPKVKFTTKIWHPNVSSVTGCICLDILKDKWEVVSNLRIVLLSIQALLTSPEPDDPQDGVVASQYKDHKELFDRTAKYWTTKYAGATKTDEEFDKKVKELMGKGKDGAEVTEEKARVALSNSNWDMTKAVEKVTDA